jgi:hypothetical protein
MLKCKIIDNKNIEKCKLKIEIYHLEFKQANMVFICDLIYLIN